MFIFFKINNITIYKAKYKVEELKIHRIDKYFKEKSYKIRHRN